MSGAAIAAEVAQAIREASAEVGTGAPLAGTLIRQGAGTDKTTYPFVRGADAEFAVSVILTSYSAQDRAGGAIGPADVKAMIAADGEAPRQGDSLRVGGITYGIVSVQTVQPGGVALYHEAQARAG